MAAHPRCYVAMGDSFSAGLGTDEETPWPEAVAGRLRNHQPQLRFANLARVGATTADVRAGQLPRALELGPDLVSLICGANDVLLSVRPDTDAVEQRLDGLMAGLEELDPAPLIVTATYPDIATFLPLRRRTAERVSAGIDRLNEVVRRVSERHGAHLLEWSGHHGVGDPENFADDDFHPSPIGHVRAAAAFAEGISEVVEL